MASAPRRTDADLLSEASDLLSHILRHVGALGEVNGYGQPGSAEHVLGCARALSRHSRFDYREHEQTANIGSVVVVH